MNIEIPKVVLTGGPCAGKSEVLTRLETDFREEIEVVPEAARMVLESGFPVPGQDVEWSQEWQDRLQEAILPTQYALEDAAMTRAKDLGKSILLCDRGLLDGAAYWREGWMAYLQRFKLDVAEMRKRYQHVFHLKSLAMDFPDAYLAQDRMEDLETARTLDSAVLSAWDCVWMGVRVVPVAESFEEKYQNVRTSLVTIIYETKLQRARQFNKRYNDYEDEFLESFEESDEFYVGMDYQKREKLQQLLEKSDLEIEKRGYFREELEEILDEDLMDETPEGWENWLKDPDTDPDAWDMPDSWYD